MFEKSPFHGAQGPLNLGPSDLLDGRMEATEVIAHCRILGFATEYSTSVRKLTAT